MTMFDEMEVGIHLPLGNLNIGNPDVSKDAPPPVQEKHHHHHHHDEESQIYSQRISLPLQR